MDQDPADQTARQWQTRSASGDERDGEIARLRERLAFYQSFEGLIQDNIARSGELLRQAMEMREGAANEIAAAQAEALRQRAEDRSRYRIHFSAMLDELTALQGQAERLARRLTIALDEIELDLPTGAIALSLSEIDLGDEGLLEQALALDAGTLIPFTDADIPVTAAEEEEPLTFAETTEEPPAVDEPVEQPTAELPLPESESVAADPPTAAEPATETAPIPPGVYTESTPDEVAPIGEAEDIPLDIQPFATEDITASRHFAAGNDLALQPTVDPGAIHSELPSTSTALATNSTIVLVHGVPRATTALSLKRYLEGLDHVGNVEPREFAEGILRLEVSGERPLAFDDLRSWPEGETLEPVHLRDDLVEVRLST